MSIFLGDVKRGDYGYIFVQPTHVETFSNTANVAEKPSREAMVATAKRIQDYLYGSWDEPEAKKCTCGVQHTGGLHSDWCDLGER